MRLRANGEIHLRVKKDEKMDVLLGSGVISRGNAYHNIRLLWDYRKGAFQIPPFIKNRAEYPTCKGGDESPRAEGTKNMI